MPEKWDLDIYSWAGISLGATHFYVDLTCYKRKVYMTRIEHVLSERAASLINEKVRKEYIEGYREIFLVKPGQLHPGFETYDEAIKFGIDKFQELAEVGDKLIDKRTNKIVSEKLESNHA